MMSTIQLSSSITMSPPEPIIKGTHFRQNIWGKVALGRGGLSFFMLKCGFVKLMKLLVFIDEAFIDYGYIDMYNTDITF